MQVMAVSFATLIEAGFVRGGGMGSPGLDEVRWWKPVRPGDTIVMQARVTEIKLFDPRAPTAAMSSSLFEVMNQKRERVMSYSCVEIVRRRTALNSRAATA